MIILGIDPGLRTTGFGVIEKHGTKLRYIASGTIKTGSETALPPRLKVIFAGIAEIIRTYQPDCAAIEKVFVNVNPQSTLLLGQARGAAITALVGADLDLLLITTAREGLTPDELAANPLSGHLVSVRVGAVGLAPPPAVL